MKKPVIVAGIVVGTLSVVVVMAVALGPQDDQNSSTKETRSTTISSTTEATNDQRATKNDTSRQEQGIKKLPKKAVYVAYDEKTFSDHADRQRILFFYDKSQAQSVALDAVISESLTSLPNNVSIFKTTLKESSEEAKTLGVTEPGVALSFTDETQLKGVYVAPDKPSLDTFLTVLAIDE